MRQFGRLVRRFHEDEQGHATIGVLSLAAAIGAIVLGIGAAGDSDGVAIAGGVVLGVGVLGASVVRHREIDYDIYRRLEQLEKK